jgi:hypothetical protein
MTAHADRPRMRIARRAVAATGIVFCLATAAPAGEVADKAAEAETLLQSGEAGPAFEALSAAVDSFWASAPLTIKQAYFVTDEDGAKFSQRPDGAFRSGETARVHLEPLGYGFREDSGTFRIALTTSIELRTPGGLILAKTEDFGRLEWAGRAKSRTFNGRVGIDLPDLKAGDYELLVTVSDEATKKTASVTLPFTVAAN